MIVLAHRLDPLILVTRYLLFVFYCFRYPAREDDLLLPLHLVGMGRDEAALFFVPEEGTEHGTAVADLRSRLLLLGSEKRGFFCCVEARREQVLGWTSTDVRLSVPGEEDGKKMIYGSDR